MVTFSPTGDGAASGIQRRPDWEPVGRDRVPPVVRYGLATAPQYLSQHVRNCRGARLERIVMPVFSYARKQL